MDHKKANDMENGGIVNNILERRQTYSSWVISSHAHHYEQHRQRANRSSIIEIRPGYSLFAVRIPTFGQGGGARSPLGSSSSHCCCAQPPELAPAVPSPLLLPLTKTVFRMAKDDGYRSLAAQPAQPITDATMNVLVGPFGPCRFDPRFHHTHAGSKWVTRVVGFVRRKLRPNRSLRSDPDHKTLISVAGSRKTDPFRPRH
uniref:Uncharacterized protein n=1 Tax=Steinernema glaseri TaxID=37863 RepID=A0A1I7ZHM0_9BILA